MYFEDCTDHVSSNFKSSFYELWFGTADFLVVLFMVYLHEFEENNSTKIFIKCLGSVVEFIRHKL